jgi:glutaconate CoA-transferase, subunit B
MFLSGLQIDQWGNCNVTALGYPDIKLKLPGGGGGNLSCDAAHTEWLLTELGLFDFDLDGHMRLKAVYPDTSTKQVLENTEFTPSLCAEIGTIPAPDRPVVELIRKLDPLKIHEKEIRAEDMQRRFAIVWG